MPDALRKRLAARTTRQLIETKASFGHLTEAQKKSPSQRNSERLRKKLNRGKQIVKTLEDCRGCPDYPCGKTLVVCHVVTRTMRCPKCGMSVLYRYILDEPWKGCPSCVR